MRTFPSLKLAPIPSPVVGLLAGQAPTCWVGEEERQCWKRRLRSSHRSLHVEPEMIPFLYWSHWGGEGKERSSVGADTCSPDGSRLIPTACDVQHPKHMNWGCTNPLSRHQPHAHCLLCPNPSVALIWLLELGRRDCSSAAFQQPQGWKQELQ